MDYIFIVPDMLVDQILSNCFIGFFKSRFILICFKFNKLSINLVQFSNMFFGSKRKLEANNEKMEISSIAPVLQRISRKNTFLAFWISFHKRDSPPSTLIAG